MHFSFISSSKEKKKRLRARGYDPGEKHFLHDPPRLCFQLGYSVIVLVPLGFVSKDCPLPHLTLSSRSHH